MIVTQDYLALQPRHVRLGIQKFKFERIFRPLSTLFADFFRLALSYKAPDKKREHIFMLKAEVTELPECASDLLGALTRIPPNSVADQNGGIGLIDPLTERIFVHYCEVMRSEFRLLRGSTREGGCTLHGELWMAFLKSPAISILQIA